MNELNNGNGNGIKKQRSRKYRVILMVTSIIIIYMLASMAMAFMGIEMSIDGMGAGMPILFATYPAYLGANSWQKSCEAKKNGNKKE